MRVWCEPDHYTAGIFTSGGGESTAAYAPGLPARCPTGGQEPTAGAGAVARLDVATRPEVPAVNCHYTTDDPDEGARCTTCDRRPHQGCGDTQPIPRWCGACGWAAGANLDCRVCVAGDLS